MKPNTTKTQNNFTFPIGYRSFHKNKQLNFRINQLYSLGYWTEMDAQQIGASIHDVGECQRDLIAFAEQKDAEGRALAAAFGYRLAEFYTHHKDPDKMALYQEFYDRFYKAVQGEAIEHCSIPYQNGVLPALRFTLENSKGTIFFTGGLDSLMEELYSVARYIVDAGYEVILFEGPGQGAARRKSNLYMTHEWEKPTSAVLDYFDLSDVTLIGLSMGGFLAPRAAAFDDRINRVVAFDITPYDLHGSGLQRKIFQWFLRNPSIYNRIANFSIRMSAQAEQIIGQWMYVTGASTPAEWNEKLQHYSVSDVAKQIHQDVLLLAGAEDQAIPLMEYHKNLNGLPNARSVTGRIFTTEEHAQNHCQVGNIKLALDVILKWVEEKSN